MSIPTTFPRFPNLPNELQTSVWQHASEFEHEGYDNGLLLQRRQQRQQRRPRWSTQHHNLCIACKSYNEKAHPFSIDGYWLFTQPAAVQLRLDNSEYRILIGWKNGMYGLLHVCYLARKVVMKECRRDLMRRIGDIEYTVTGCDSKCAVTRRQRNSVVVAMLEDLKPK